MPMPIHRPIYHYSTPAVIKSQLIPIHTCDAWPNNNTGKLCNVCYTTVAMSTIQALTLDLQQDGWSNSRGFVKREVPQPTLTNDASVILKIRFAGLCGSDR